MRDGQAGVMGAARDRTPLYEHEAGTGLPHVRFPIRDGPSPALFVVPENETGCEEYMKKRT